MHSRSPLPTSPSHPRPPRRRWQAHRAGAPLWVEARGPSGQMLLLRTSRCGLEAVHFGAQAAEATAQRVEDAESDIQGFLRQMEEAEATMAALEERGARAEKVVDNLELLKG